MKIENVFLISIDDLRFDCISCEKDKRWLERYCAHTLVDTPVLDSVAERGVRFTQCISTSSYTPAPHTSMLTGLYPKHHKIRTFFNILPENVQTLPEILKKKGWHTAAWCEHLTFGMQKMLKGIDTVVEPFDRESNLFAFMDSLPHKSFAFIHLFDVHKPYLYTTGGTERHSYNEEYLKEMEAFSKKIEIDFNGLLLDAENEARRVVKAYDRLAPSLREYAQYRSLDYLIRRELQKMDTLFEEIIPLYVRGVNKCDTGKFKDLITCLEEKGFFEDSLIVIGSDHGETRCTWGDREDFMNSFNVSEGAIRVPLILCGGTYRGVVVDTPVSVIDIAPTIADLISVDFPCDGCSLIPFIEGDAPLERTLFSESWAYQGESTFFGKASAPLQEEFLAEACARKGGYKYVWRNKKVGASGGYNYEEDPFEEREVPEEKVTSLKNEVHTYQLDYQIEKVKPSCKF